MRNYLTKTMQMVRDKSLDGVYVFLVHGFNTKDKGDHTIDQLEPILTDAGAIVEKDEMDYGYYGLLDIRLRNGENRRRVLHRMASAFERAVKAHQWVAVVAYSNGPHFTDMALRMLPVDIQSRVIVVYISAAMNRKTEPTMATSHELNLITPHDGWVKLASLLPFKHPWGRRGARGYTGTSNKVENIKRKEVKKHSDWFIFAFLFMTLYFVMKFIREKMK